MEVPGLGTLATLPPELRSSIWDYLSPDHRHSNKRLCPNKRLSFLQTSHLLHFEASYGVYGQLSMTFCIKPIHEQFSWASVSTNRGGQWHLKDLADARAQGFGQLPFIKLKSIKILIEAPCPQDPGQIVCLWRKCLDLAELLGGSRHGLPDLEIHFRDTELAKWFIDGKPVNTFSSAEAKTFRFREYWHSPKKKDSILEDESIFEDDIQIVLAAFGRLHNARTAKILYPSNDVWTDAFIEKIASNLAARGNVDRQLEEHQDRLFTNIELELDMLPGQTANLVPVDRFSAWYEDRLDGKSRYEEMFKKIIQSRISRGGYNPIPLKRQLLRRYDGLRCLNPKSLTNQGSTRASMHLVVGQKTDGWDQNAWHTNASYTRQGIPPLNSQRFERMCASRCYYYYGQGTTHMDEYKKKIQGWEADGASQSPVHTDAQELFGK